MLKFWPITILFILFAVAIAIFFYHFLAWILLILSYIAIITYGSANIQSGFFTVAFCHGDQKQKKVALTFDDGPEPENTPMILNFLKNAGIKATFFCVGKKIEKYPEIAARINNEGHIIGNHSYSHSNFFPLKPVVAIRKELIDTREIIENITKIPNVYFRPPFGVTNPKIKKVLKGLDFRVIGWSIRSFDLSKKSSNKIVEHSISKLRGGDIILLHDTSQQILPILSHLLEYLKLLGWEVVRLDDLVNSKIENKDELK